MTKVVRGHRAEGARRRPAPRLMASAAVAAMLVALASGAAAAGAGPKGKPPRPTPTVTITPTPPPTPTPTPTPTFTATPTPTSSPTPTPSPTTCGLGTVDHDGSAWCVATVDQVADDVFASGTPVALVGAPVEWTDARYVYVTGTEPPCPPGMFCGAFVRVAAIDVSGIASPTIGYTVDAWGTTRTGGVLVAAGIRATS